MFDTLSEKFQGAFKALRGKGRITEENIEEALKQVRTALLEADVHFKVAKDFINNIKTKALGEKVISGVNPDQQFIKIVQDELTALMGDKNQNLSLNGDPAVVLVVGLNGAGKTTFVGKLALHLRNKEKKDVYLIPADNFRPAAKEQLLIHARNIGVEYFDSDLKQTSLQIVQAGMAEAKKLGKKVVIIDTAGRLQVDAELMNQLADVKKALKAYEPETLLVADAMTGQEAVNVALEFHNKMTLTGAVLSKMDSDARGGAALSIRYMTGVPIKFISNGEKLKDLDPFHPERLAGRMLDMGDVVSLVEKAQEVIDEKEAEAMMKKMEKNRFTINDFRKQMGMMASLGSMESVLKMIPGMGGVLRQVGDLSPAQEEMKKMNVIIDSMTEQERENHKLLNESRRMRISRGSGRPVQDIAQFIQKFEQMQQMMSGMMGMMKGGGLPGMGGAQKGFRQQAGGNPFEKMKKKGKSKGPWGGGGFFNR
ncbi:MAG: signal recognition particle protein [Bacteriovoracaceae bacterium]|nr:signal recognition particle protein [Bacteriovoracaceae bacterium]